VSSGALINLPGNICGPMRQAFLLKNDFYGKTYILIISFSNVEVRKEFLLRELTKTAN